MSLWPLIVTVAESRHIYSSTLKWWILMEKSQAKRSLDTYDQSNTRHSSPPCTAGSPQHHRCSGRTCHLWAGSRWSRPRRGNTRCKQRGRSTAAHSGYLSAHPGTIPPRRLTCGSLQVGWSGCSGFLDLCQKGIARFNQCPIWWTIPLKNNWEPT